jgi:hypothetical protein
MAGLNFQENQKRAAMRKFAGLTIRFRLTGNRCKYARTAGCEALI